MSERLRQGSAAHSSEFMAPLVVTGRRLHPRDGFPSALSALSTAAPGYLSKATPTMFMGVNTPG